MINSENKVESCKDITEEGDRLENEFTKFWKNYDPNKEIDTNSINLSISLKPLDNLKTSSTSFKSGSQGDISLEENTWPFDEPWSVRKQKIRVTSEYGSKNILYFYFLFFVFILFFIFIFIFFIFVFVLFFIDFCFSELHNWDLFPLIVKYDNCRNEALAMQLIRKFAKIFEQNKKTPLFLYPYEILLQSQKCAMIEVVPG